MDHLSDSATSRILKVLLQINERLEEQDERLRAVVSAIHDAKYVSQPQKQEDAIPISMHFWLFHTLSTTTLDGGVNLSEIKVSEPDLLRVLRAIFEPPCPSRRDEDLSPMKIAYPFEPFRIYWDILASVARGSPEETEQTFVEHSVSESAKEALDRLLR